MAGPGLGPVAAFSDPGTGDRAVTADRAESGGGMKRDLGEIWLFSVGMSMGAMARATPAGGGCWMLPLGPGPATRVEPAAATAAAAAATA